MKVKKHKRNEATPEGETEAIFLGPDSPFILFLRQQLDEMPAEARNMSLEELRELLDKELGDISLSGELLRMRHESL